ncbi:putative inactive poly [ADP-ribose] polymerase SRO5 [Nicotiana tabacum]|uniref:Inactive poly [ADP-ribose] polymerase SRO5 n=2 Tax=Nicotiana tabacum TaxID=4097 RepID=A0AC58SNC2_TOBAC|nr:PREDICTED: probable inactive poly [ADP-ribose] polymerase SRO5 [Nicotiana tabacum]
MVPNKLNAKRRRLEDPAESASSSSNPRNKIEVRSPTTTDRMCGVSCSKTQERAQLFGNNDLVRLNQDHKVYKVVTDKFVSGLGALGSSLQVEAIHMNVRSSFVSQTRFQSFLLVAKTMEKKYNGHASKKLGWYGTSKEKIIDIISNGFVPLSYRHGVQFSARDYPLDCLQTAVQDKDGLRHLLLCKLVLGRSELVIPGSGQFQPSSEDLDSGVDSFTSPRTYIVWSSRLSTHVFPEVIVSVRVSPHSKGVDEYRPTLSKNVNLRISVDALITRLSRILPSHAIKLIKEYYNDRQKGKTTAQEFVRQVSQVAGNSLLISIIKSISAQRNLAQPRPKEQ